MAAAGLEHRFGPYGGQYVPETLMPALAELETAWLAARRDPSYAEELAVLSRDFSGRRRCTSPSASARPPATRSGSSART
jgi:tryptophan synthase beta subunit